MAYPTIQTVCLPNGQMYGMTYSNYSNLMSRCDEVINPEPYYSTTYYPWEPIDLLGLFEDIMTINNKNNNMLHSRIASLFKNKDTKTLERAEIQHPNGQLTGDGQELLLQLFLKKNKKEVVELAKQLIEDRK